MLASLWNMMVFRRLLPGVHQRIGVVFRHRGLPWMLLALCAGQAQALQLEVRVSGLAGAREENVLALLAIYQEREDKDLAVPRLLALHRRAPEQIRSALAPYGLYRVEVESQLTEPVQPEGTWVADYRVSPGDAVKIGRVDYRILGPGADNPAFPKTFPMKVGDVLLHADYDKARDEIRSIASKQGYLDARLVHHQVLIDMLTYEALIDGHAPKHRIITGFTCHWESPPMPQGPHPYVKKPNHRLWRSHPITYHRRSLSF